jgi:hypothetical protein
MRHIHGIRWQVAAGLPVIGVLLFMAGCSAEGKGDAATRRSCGWHPRDSGGLMGSRRRCRRTLAFTTLRGVSCTAEDRFSLFQQLLAVLMQRTILCG